MTELSLNILDIVQNSVAAGASLIEIYINESIVEDKLEVVIKDNGRGIPKQIIDTVDDPFTTTRTTRKTGLGLPLLRHHACLTGGDIEIKSEEGKGTEVKAFFGLSHIDRQPLGDITGVLIILMSANPDIDFLYKHSTQAGNYSFSTIEAKRLLEVKKINDYGLLRDIGEMIRENLISISVSE